MAISFFHQERPESCVPACIRMILSAFGITKTEPEIYECCQTDSEGTLAKLAAACVESFGLEAAAARLTTLEELKSFVTQSRSHVIAFVNLAPLHGINVLHAVIVTIIDEQAFHIQVIDPANPPHGERVWSLGQFELAWQLARFQIILISQAAS